MTVDGHLQDGEVLDLGTVKLEVIHTVGHSQTLSASMIGVEKYPSLGTLVVGGTTVINDFIVVRDLDAHLASIAKLQKMDLKLMLMDHPYLPF